MNILPPPNYRSGGASDLSSVNDLRSLKMLPYHAVATHAVVILLTIMDELPLFRSLITGKKFYDQ